MNDQAEQNRRLKSFDVTASDLALLRGLTPYVRERLPHLLVELHAAFADWPVIQAALTRPQVHALRLRHWGMVVCGQFGAGFLDSARALAIAFCENGIPGYAATVCHASVMAGILRDLESQPKRMFGAARASGAVALRTALNKAVWLDVEVLLETYAEEEKRARDEGMMRMAETVERDAGHAVEQVTALARGMSLTATQMSSSAAAISRDATEAAQASADTERTAQMVASAAEQLSASIGGIKQ